VRTSGAENKMLRKTWPSRAATKLGDPPAGTQLMHCGSLHPAASLPDVMPPRTVCDWPWLRTGMTAEHSSRINPPQPAALRVSSTAPVSATASAKWPKPDASGAACIISSDACCGCSC
jgi:hypothetical protein